MKRALVTGASSGIGKAITLALLEDGWAVIGASRSLPSFRHSFFQWAMCNVAVGFQVDGIREYLENNTLDALIHCAGSQQPVGPLESSDPHLWAVAIQANLVGTYNVTRLALPYLKRSDDGRALLFSGGGAFGPRPNFSAYAASKAGVVSLAETLAEEMRGRVSVNCVSPGFVATPIHAPTLMAGPEKAGETEYARATQQSAGAMPNVLACVRHLLSPDTKGLTGKTISAVYDPWYDVNQGTVDWFNAQEIWVRTRVKALKVPCPVGVA